MAKRLEWLTTLETAEWLGTSVDRVRQLIHSGKLPAQRSGPYWFVHRDDAEVRKFAMEARPQRPMSHIFRIADRRTGNVRTADLLGQGKLRYAATHRQVCRISAMAPGDVLEFRSDVFGLASWKVECLGPLPGMPSPPPLVQGPGERILFGPAFKYER